MKRLLISFIIACVLAVPIAAQQPVCNPGDTLTPPCSQSATTSRPILVQIVLAIIALSRL